MTRFPTEVKERALVLLETEPALPIAQIVQVLKAEFPGQPTPKERTLRDWKRQAEQVDDPAEPLETPHDPALAFSRKLANLKQRLAEERKARKQAELRADFIAELTQVIAAHVPAAPAVVLPKRSPLTGTPLTVIVHFSDWHYNEKVERRRFFGYQENEFPGMYDLLNEYDLQISEKRIRYAFQAGLREIIDRRDPKRVERVLVVFNGDLNSGDIHSLPVSNCIPSAAAAMRLADIIIEELLIYRRELPWACLDVIFKVGNHGRILEPGQAKGTNAKFIEQNYDWLTGEAVKKALSRQENMTVENSPSAMSLRDIYGKVHMFTHGHAGIRGGGGISKIPVWGFAKFIYQQIAMLLQMVNRPVDHVHLGHWHQAFEGEYGTGMLMVGRSLIGQTERGVQLGYSPLISQRITFCTPEYSNGLGAGYPLDVPSFLPETQPETQPH